MPGADLGMAADNGAVVVSATFQKGARLGSGHPAAEVRENFRNQGFSVGCVDRALPNWKGFGTILLAVHQLHLGIIFQGGRKIALNTPDRDPRRLPDHNDTAASVREWLRSLGLERYADAFAENAVDWQVLPNLNSDDLRDIGVTAVGHRRRLLQAIAALTEIEPRAPEPAASGAERRQLTVMFCDLVGSTALAARLDPEDLRDLMGSHHAVVAEEVRRLDGFVAKYMGDGVLAYFGYPQAHEDDAERAIHSALAVIDRVSGLGGTVQLQTRIGIATGLVVVGDLLTSDEGQERGVIGETPNLAARLQGIAKPNSVMISGATRRLLGDLFEYRELGPVELKGFGAAVPVWQVQRTSTIESRFEALHAGGMTPLIGRQEQLALL